MGRILPCGEGGGGWESSFADFGLPEVTQRGVVCVRLPFMDIGARNVLSNKYLEAS